MAATKDFPDPALARESRAWTREVEQRVKLLEAAASRTNASEINTNKAQNSSINLVSNQIVDLDVRVQEAIDSITIDATQIVSGSISSARISGLSGSVLTGGVVAIEVNAGANNVYGANVTGANVFAQSVATIITATRVAVWGRTSDGYIATASSSRQYKDNIEPADIDPLAVLSLEPKHYQWIEQLRMRDDPTYEGYVGPHHHVAVEAGFIAEEMHDLGLWQFVVYKRNPDDSLMLGPDGGAIPEGIHYQMLPVALVAVERYLFWLIQELFEQNDRLTQRLDTLESRLARLENPEIS